MHGKYTYVFVEVKLFLATGRFGEQPLREFDRCHLKIVWNWLMRQEREVI